MRPLKGYNGLKCWGRLHAHTQRVYLAERLGPTACGSAIEFVVEGMGSAGVLDKSRIVGCAGLTQVRKQKQKAGGRAKRKLKKGETTS